MSGRHGGLAIGLAAIALGVPGGLAVAHHVAPATEAPSPPPQVPAVTADEARKQMTPEEAAAFDRFCPKLPCLTVDAGGDTAKLGVHTTAQALVAFGREPQSCPEALEEYRAARVEIGAFLGRCPTLAEAKRLAETALETEQTAVAVER